MSVKRRLQKAASNPVQRQRYIERAWKNYEAVVLPKTAGESQRLETRRAFFAGAGILFELMNKASEGDEDEACKVLDDIHSELSEYGQALDRSFFGATRGQA